MYKHFLKPLRIVLGVCMLTTLGIAADIAQLTNFNILDFLKKHSPQSYYFLFAGTLMIYLVLVIIEFIREASTQQSLTPDRISDQFINTRDVNNSTIIQISKNKEG